MQPRNVALAVVASAAIAVSACGGSSTTTTTTTSGASGATGLRGSTTGGTQVTNTDLTTALVENKLASAKTADCVAKILQKKLNDAQLQEIVAGQISASNPLADTIGGYDFACLQK